MRYSKIRSNKKQKSKKLYITLAGLTALFLTIGTIAWMQRNDSNSSQQNPQPYTGEIRYEEATDEEKQQSEQSKDKLVEDKKRAEEEAANRPPGSKKAVSPVITLASQNGDTVTVQAFVPGIFEEGGTCTASLKQGSLTVTKQTAAFANATTTDCQHMTIPRSEFQATGSWAVSVTYTSATAEGTSAQQQSVTIQ